MTIEDAREIVDERITKKLEQNPSAAAEIGKSVALEVEGEFDARWLIDCSRTPAVVSESTDDAEAIIRIDSEALGKMLSGEISPQMAFMSGKIKVDGDLGAAVRLGQFLM